MNRPTSTISTSILLFLLLSLALAANAQNDQRQQIDPSYEVVLQIVIGGNDRATNQPLPQNLGNIAKQLRTNFAYTEYRLANTYIGRIANGGNFEYKSISNVFGIEQEGETPSFWDWSLAGLRTAPNAAGKSDFQIQGFRFGARIPIRTSSFKDEAGKTQPVFNYESIGLNLSRMTLSENGPTLIGSLSLPKTSGTVFLVLTMRQA